MAYTTIDDPSEYFQTAIYTGNASTLAVTSQGNADITPDWIWIKRRSADSTHALFDSTRGRAKSSGSEAVDTEFNSPSDKDLISFNANGFTVGPANQRNTNGDSETFVAWQWAANGGTTATNDASSTSIGSIDSVIQANTDAGFSVVTWTGTGSAGTIAHGLGAVPSFILFKNRGADVAWSVYYGDPTDYLVLNTNAATVDNSNRFNDTAPTSTVFSVGDSNTVNADSNTYVAYCFANIQGYSKAGTYKGTGNVNGAFLYTGFKPAWIIVKATDQDEWRIYDNKRANEFNVINVRLKPHLVAAESQDDSECDFLSNGIKFRSTSGGVNTGAQTYFYMAFAESPFVSSKGTPTTAR